MRSNGKRARWAWVAAMFCSVLVARSADASMALAVSLRELVERADHVVLARAVAAQSHYDRHGRIVTDVEVVVERSEKGPSRAGDSLLVRTLGGEVDGVGTRVVGAPVFEIGQRQLLFAIDDPHGGGFLHTLELSQGLMRVFEQDGATWVHGGGEGLALRKRGPDGRMQPARHGRDRRLEDVLDEVKQLLTEGRR